MASTATLFSGIPWGVLIMLVGLGLLAEMLAESKVFARIAVVLSQYSGNRPAILLGAAAVVMFVVSSLSTISPHWSWSCLRSWCCCA